MLLEAALLSSSTTPLSHFSAVVDSSSNENYSHNHNDTNQLINAPPSTTNLDDLTNDELFVYHGRIGQRIDYTTHDTSVNNNEPYYLSSIHQPKTHFNPTNELSNNPRHSKWIQSHNELGHSFSPNSNTNILRPSLPEIAPVSLPDFSSHPLIQTSFNRMPWYSSSITTNKHHQVTTRPLLLPSTTTSSTTNKHRLIDPMDLSSDYDNLYPNSSFHTSSNKYYSDSSAKVLNSQNNHKRCSTSLESTAEAPATKNNGFAAVVVRPSLRKLTKVSRPHWPEITPGEESDAMSGYIGDAASSVYDTDDDDADTDNDDEDDDDKGGDRKINDTNKITNFNVGVSVEVEVNRNKHSDIIHHTSLSTPVSMNQKSRLANPNNNTTTRQSPTVNNDYANIFQIDGFHCSDSLNNECASHSIAANNNCQAILVTRNTSNNGSSSMLSLAHKRNSTMNHIDSINDNDDKSGNSNNCTITMGKNFNFQQSTAHPHRTVSISDSHTSGGRSEYDNVEKSGSQTENNSLLRTFNDHHQLEVTNSASNYDLPPNEQSISSSPLSVPSSLLSLTTIAKVNPSSSSIKPLKSFLDNNTSSSINNQTIQNGNSIKTSRIPLPIHSFKQHHSLFDAQIAAEARRISRQFRVMGWMPVGGEQLITDTTTSEHSDGGSIQYNRQQPLINSFHRDNTNEENLLPSSSLHRPHLFLLPGSSQISRSCSRQTSLRNKPRYATNGCNGFDSETVTTVTSQLDDDDDERALDLNDEDYDIDVLQESNMNVNNNNNNGNHQFFIRPGFLGDEDVVNGDVPLESDVEKWTYQNFGNPQLGCLLVRPRSLSETCLNIMSTVCYDDDNDLHINNDIECELECNSTKISRVEKPSGESKYSSPRLKRLRKRTAHVRNLLPPDLHRFILPGCISSLSRSSSMCTSSHYTATTTTISGMLFLSLSRRTSYHRHREHRQRHRSHQQYQQNNHCEQNYFYKDEDDEDLSMNQNYINSKNNNSKLRMPNSIRYQQQYLSKFSIDNRKWASDPELHLTSTCQTIEHLVT
ncbi:Ca(2+)/calmodulin-responsive adenylate cyclase [Schistosoma japonicum]|uniref:Ca(2+)/calmodulin-responsive adenylate cyclase n=1 Tax=Schistosoma japonicum TaxID=6182 RepID=A0A4Z2CQ19_SCHJA|nr:Ca(2+)/calmodulin-responsive adenylate cyclase [Schistosoma japonicum]